MFESVQAQFQILLPNASTSFLSATLSLLWCHFFCFFSSLLLSWHSCTSRLAILLPSRLGGDPKDQILLRVRPSRPPIPLLHLLPSLQLFPVVMLPVDDDVAAAPWWWSFVLFCEREQGLTFGFMTPLHQRFSSWRLLLASSASTLLQQFGRLNIFSNLADWWNDICILRDQEAPKTIYPSVLL